MCDSCRIFLLSLTSTLRAFWTWISFLAWFLPNPWNLIASLAWFWNCCLQEQTILLPNIRIFFSAFTFFKNLFFFFKLCMCLYHLSFWNSFRLIFWPLTLLDLPLFSPSSLHWLCLVSFSYGPLLLLPIIRHFQGTRAGPQRCEILDLGPKACLCMYRVGVNGMGLSSSVDRYPRGLSIKNLCIWKKKKNLVFESWSNPSVPHTSHCVSFNLLISEQLILLVTLLNLMDPE